MFSISPVTDRAKKTTIRSVNDLRIQSDLRCRSLCELFYLAVTLGDWYRTHSNALSAILHYRTKMCF